MSGALLLRRAPVNVQGPFVASAVVWREPGGMLLCTLVAKATYELVAGDTAPLDTPLPLHDEDSHWDDDDGKSVHMPSDLVPFKKAPEVVVVGSAFAPPERPAASVRARVLVGSVDKSILIARPRRFRSDGSIEEAAPAPRFSLRYEHASGGVDTDNPVGVDPALADARGRFPIPGLLPVGFEPTRPGEHVPVVGLGPLAPSWPGRAGCLSDADRAWLAAPREAPLPPSFPARFFQSAPPDQWLDRPLAANERIVLEGLDAKAPRLVVSLSGIEPRIVAPGVSGQDSRLRGDLLVIDTDRCLMTLTFRKTLAIDEGDLRGMWIVGVPLGSPEVTEASDDHGELDDRTQQIRTRFRKATLPFTEHAPATLSPARGPSVDTALPFRERSSPPPPPPPPAVPALVPEPVNAPIAAPKSAPPPARASVPSPALVPLPLATRSGSEERERPRGLGIPPLEASPAPAIEEASSRRALVSDKHPQLLQGLRARDANAGSGGVRALSDAAAAAERSTEIAPRLRDPSPIAPRVDPSSRRRVVVHLRWHDPAIVPRLRGLPRLASVWASQPARALASVDTPRPEPAQQERADVLRALSFGRPSDPSEIRRALAESLDDPSDLETPLLLLEGELRPSLDEVEMLRVAVAVAQMAAGGEKKVLAAIAVAMEALAAPVPPRAEAVLGLVAKIEQAAALPSLPPRYVASEVERVLIEGRKYKRRTLLGAPRVRAELAGREGPSPPLYLPDTVASALPMLPTFPVVALCELRPREDLAEPASESLFVVALGRVIVSRGEGEGKRA